MDWIHNFLQLNHGVILFAYGLTFFVLGTVDFFKVPMTPTLAACIFFGLLIAGGPEPLLKASMDMKYIPVYRTHQPANSRSSTPPPAPSYRAPSIMTPEQLERLKNTLGQRDDKRQ